MHLLFESFILNVSIHNKVFMYAYICLHVCMRNRMWKGGRKMGKYVDKWREEVKRKLKEWLTMQGDPKKVGSWFSLPSDKTWSSICITNFNSVWQTNFVLITDNREMFLKISLYHRVSISIIIPSCYKILKHFKKNQSLSINMYIKVRIKAIRYLTLKKANIM